jgi:UDP-N-acetylglucosamine 2-epimerase (non-hydrolysing)
MSRQFFEELQIPEADINLGICSGTHAEQVGQTMIELEKVIRSEKPDWVVVVGDVNATDRLADLLLTPDHLSGDNLRREGTPEHRIRFTQHKSLHT